MAQTHPREAPDWSLKSLVGQFLNISTHQLSHEYVIEVHPEPVGDGHLSWDAHNVKHTRYIYVYMHTSGCRHAEDIDQIKLKRLLSRPSYYRVIKARTNGKAATSYDTFLDQYTKRLERSVHKKNKAYGSLVSTCKAFNQYSSGEWPVCEFNQEMHKLCFRSRFNMCAMPPPIGTMYRDIARYNREDYEYTEQDSFVFIGKEGTLTSHNIYERGKDYGDAVPVDSDNDNQDYVEHGRFRGHRTRGDFTY